MEIRQWLQDVEAQLQRLHKLRELYSENKIHPPDNCRFIDILSAVFEESVPATILDFYTSCGGIDLGDIHNGYWIFPIPFLLGGIRDSFPTKVAGPNGTYNILVFGKDTGGNYLASRLGDSEEVLYLPTGDVTDFVFDGVSTPVVHLADDFYEFLLRLLEDIKADVNDIPDHCYMDHDFT